VETFKTPSPQKNYFQAKPQVLKEAQQKNTVEMEEILRKKIEETNHKINQLMSSAITQNCR